MKNILLHVFVFLFVFSSNAQDTWVLEKNKNGIKVFTRKAIKSNIKDSKSELNISDTPDAIIKEFRNVANHKNWMHRINTSELIKKVNDNEFYTYYIAGAPWPVSDRDVVVKYTIKKVGTTNYKIECVGVPNEIPKKENKIRVPMLKATWDITQNKDGSSKIVYTTSSEPGGSIPDWLANSSATDTPYETVSKLKSTVEK